VLHTPGHTPESISFLLTDVSASEEPVMIFTGDFVFVGDIGRPDLLEKAAGLVGTQDKGAHQMFESIQKFTALADYIQVWPGHGAGSACGKALGAVPSSTVGYEKVRNWAFRFQQDEAGFINFLLADQPEPPKYFAMMKKLNKVDRPLLTSVPKLKQLNTEELMAAMKQGIKVIDTRLKMDFAAGYIPGTLNIQGNNAFATWAGWFLNYGESFILLADPEQLDDLTRKLMRIGLDNILGFIPSTKTWEAAGGKLETAALVDENVVKEKMADNSDTRIIDLRGVAEYKAGHIKNAANVFVGTIEKNMDKIPTESPVILHCQGGDRTAIAYSVLAKAGYKNIASYMGGINEWTANGNTLVSE